MSSNEGVIVISEDTVLQGQIRNCKRIEIYGYVDGDVSADALVVHEGGKMFGVVKVGNADIKGTLQGEVFVKNLISIRGSGAVAGNVQYGRLAVEDGGSLSADVKNVPPELFGDLQIAVRRGDAVAVTTADLNAVDPDDAADKLVFAVAKPTNGFVALAPAPGSAVSNFTQADLMKGNVLFVHDGSATGRASFDVVVSDASGASSGAPKTVQVSVRP